MSAAVFHALADPTRRHIVELLNERGTATATALSDELAISRQAVAKHLVLLSDAGLATAAKVGRETRYEPEIDALAIVRDWVDSVESAWQRRLGALAASLENLTPADEAAGDATDR